MSYLERDGSSELRAPVGESPDDIFCLKRGELDMIESWLYEVGCLCMLVKQQPVSEMTIKLVKEVEERDGKVQEIIRRR